MENAIFSPPVIVVGLTAWTYLTGFIFTASYFRFFGTQIILSTVHDVFRVGIQGIAGNVIFFLPFLAMITFAPIPTVPAAVGAVVLLVVSTGVTWLVAWFAAYLVATMDMYRTHAIKTDTGEWSRVVLLDVNKEFVTWYDPATAATFMIPASKLIGIVSGHPGNE